MIFFFFLLSAILQFVALPAIKKPLGSPVAVTTGSNSTLDTAIVTCDYNYDDLKMVKSGWRKIFEDDFDKDLSKWNIWSGGAYNNELQYYNKGNLQLKNSILNIVAKKEKVTGITRPDVPELTTFGFTSGRIESKASFSANDQTPRIRIAARMKLAAGYGMWPAFWSYGKPWPEHGEIDFVELRGQEPRQYLTNYFYKPENGENEVSGATGFITTDKDLTTCFHVYEMEWTKDTLFSYLDGKLVEAKTSGGYIDKLFGKKQHIVFNLAVGGGFFPGLDETLIQPTTFRIDWVKVFAYK